MVRMDTLETEILQNRTGMIIIDSLASIVRREFSGTDRAEMHERSIFLSKISSRLKSIAELLHVSVNRSRFIIHFTFGFNSWPYTY